VIVQPDRRFPRVFGAGAARALPWARALRRELAWILLLKFAALALLWALFFRGADRSGADDASLAQRLKLPPAAQPAVQPREPPRG
jgi:hypothetical protein